MKKFSAIAIVVSLMLSACARDMASTTYTSGDNVGKVVEGVIVSARSVKISETDKLQDNGMGGLAGGVAGGVAGSAVGKGKGNAAATVGGAIAGALIGAAIQSELGNSEGMEYIVKVAKENQSSEKVDVKNRKVTVGNDNVADSIKNSVKTSMKTELISVVQGNDVILKAGQPVYVIYNDGRARVVAAE